VQNTLEFPELLRLIDEQSIAFRATVMSAPDLEQKVPTCPDWTLLGLAQHLGAVHTRWAGIVTAGPVDVPPGPSAPEIVAAAPQEREALLAWSAAATQQFLAALREVGPDRGCWAWWDESQSPLTTGAVARHQVHEAVLHTYDAQFAVGALQPVPDEVALDGVDEFLFTVSSTTVAWPYEPAVIDVHATEGRSWRISLTADGVRLTRLPAPDATTATAVGESPDVAFASISGTAAELLLMLYDRTSIDTLTIDGDRRQLELLRDWDPRE
jgi:uncharacterized protein (TIGR03083 family)